MNHEQIQWIKDLDEKGVDGTVQAFLLNANLGEISFERALKNISKLLIAEKQALIQDNIKLSRQLEAMGGKI